MFRMLLVAISVTGVVSFSPGVVHAATGGLNIDYLTCSSGDSRFYCDMGVSGGVQPYRADWQITNGTVVEADAEHANGPCQVDTKVKAAVVVTDATGAKVSGAGYTQCRRVWP